MNRFTYVIITTLLISTFDQINNRNTELEHKFKEWQNNIEKKLKDENISNKTITIFKNKKIKLNIIKYDNNQPETYENTLTYISRRTNMLKVYKGNQFYKKNNIIINEIQKIFKVDKKLLISIMGLETNYGNNIGNIDIISSLCTLSFCGRQKRRQYFTKELIILLKLIDEEKINVNPKGSWAGAYGCFQFMPYSIKKYGIDYNSNKKIDYNSNKKIDLTKFEDSCASAAYYLSEHKWQLNKPTRLKIELDANIPHNFLNTGAKSIQYLLNFEICKKYIINSENYQIDNNTKFAIVTPDKGKLKPAYLVFHNFNVILKYNRSLKYALSVCELMDKLNFK